MSKERRASGTPGCVAGGMLSIWFPLPGPHGEETASNVLGLC